MAIQNPILNPMRFYNATELPNYADRWPGMDNVSMFTEWQKGVYASKFYRDFVLNEEMKLQFWFDSAITNPDINVYKFNSITENYQLFQTLTPVDVSPVGWVDIPVYNYSFLPTVTGIFYFDFGDADLLSDRFIVHNETKYLKQLVKISYSHYENKFDIVYLDDTTPVYEGLAYFQGRLIVGEPANEISQYIDDPGNVELLQATPQRTANLQLFTLHYSYVDLITYIFSNSEIYVNEIKYQNNEAPELEYIANSDLVNMTVKLFQSDNNSLRNT